jgi:hypothetical protein
MDEDSLYYPSNASKLASTDFVLYIRKINPSWFKHAGITIDYVENAISSRLEKRQRQRQRQYLKY